MRRIEIWRPVCVATVFRDEVTQCTAPGLLSWKSKQPISGRHILPSMPASTSDTCKSTKRQNSNFYSFSSIPKNVVAIGFVEIQMRHRRAARGQHISRENEEILCATGSSTDTKGQHDPTTALNENFEMPACDGRTNTTKRRGTRIRKGGDDWKLKTNLNQQPTQRQNRTEPTTQNKQQNTTIP